MESDALARETAEAVARRSYGKLVALLAARTRDLSSAEDALSEAFAAALAHWPTTGIPGNPEAWLLTAARRKSIDAARKKKRAELASDHITLMADELSQANENELPDQRLALMFACAHPGIDASIRAPLILQTVLGFDAATIASAFLVAPGAMSQRLVRAKTKIHTAGIPFRVPERDDLADRLDAVLEAIYAAYAEGWSDPAGTDIHRRNLAGEGIWLGRLIASLMPDEPEVLGLVALMLHTEARRDARRNNAGDFIPLDRQDTMRWNADLIHEAEFLLRRAGAMNRIGRYQLEAAVQSAHAIRRLTGSADWGAIVSLYDGLLQLTQSPVVAINRAVAIAEIEGPQAGLAALDEHTGDARLSQYQPWWAARAELLARCHRKTEAAKAYEQAIGLEPDPAIRRFLQRRQAALLGVP
ncbi:MAG: RNA polymerase sigma factor [Alphaproteobacteria bacterium]|nr:RNA polymerase sigma factor [Alphaproteobacteria bacterium]MBL6936257.1 RNA polymerase sigma factor [Alphaproteobacteria bacterium]MBL7098692.1 RNA polymerase sigma factor [Alphaproteobacteria bacterium]